MNVQKEVTERIDNYINSEKFDQHMDSIVEKAVNDVVHSMFSYGELRDAIKGVFKEKIAINVDQINFVHVNQMVAELVKEKTARAFSEPLRTKLAEELGDMFAPAPTEITVQGMVDLLREELREDGSCDCEDFDKSVTVEIQKNSYGYYLKMWDGPKTRKSYTGNDLDKDPSVSLYIRDDGTIAIIHNMHLKRNFATGIHGFDAKLFMMYCAGTRISDIESCDVDYLETYINTRD